MHDRTRERTADPTIADAETAPAVGRATVTQRHRSSSTADHEALDHAWSSLAPVQRSEEARRGFDDMNPWFLSGIAQESCSAKSGEDQQKCLDEYRKPNYTPPGYRGDPRLAGKPLSPNADIFEIPILGAVFAAIASTDDRYTRFEKTMMRGKVLQEIVGAAPGLGDATAAMQLADKAKRGKATFGDVVGTGTGIIGPGTDNVVESVLPNSPR